MSIKNNKGFTKVPNAAIPYLRELTRDEIVFWLYLRSRCFNKDHCWPSYKTIIKDLGLKHRGQVSRLLKNLVGKGWLRVHSGRGKSNRYYPALRGQSEKNQTPPLKQKGRPLIVHKESDSDSLERVRHEEEKRRRQSEKEKALTALKTMRPEYLESKSDYLKRVAEVVKKTLPFGTSLSDFNAEILRAVHKTCPGSHDTTSSETASWVHAIWDLELFPWAET